MWPFFKGYLLDEYHWVGKFINEEDSLVWVLITFNAPVVDNVINGDAGYLWEIIDPEHFEWKGRWVRLVEEVVDKTP